MSRCKITNDFTATYYDQLYCNKKSIRSAIQSIYAFGALIGMFGLPALADAKGRRFSFLFSFVLQLLGISLMILGIY
jgi:MFS family permease